MKHALCVGINYAGTGHALAGCLNDVDDWSKLLASHGFVVGTLTETQATSNNVVEGIAKLVGGLRPGDTAVLTYSGHGTWIPDRSGDEPDGRDEALVPYDVGANGKNLITDDVLADLFTRVPAGAVLVFLSDCCHSGTIYRFFPAPEASLRRPRFLPPSHFLEDDDLVHRMDRAFNQPRGRTNAPLPRLVHLSGCKDSEYSADAVIKGRPCGAFSYFATRALDAAAKAGRSYGEAFKEIRKSLPSWDYQQTPQMAAPPNLRAWPVFS